LKKALFLGSRPIFLLNSFDKAVKIAKQEVVQVMSRRVAPVVVVAIALIFAVVPAHSTVITFDTVTAGTSPLTNELASFGLLFSIVNGTDEVRTGVAGVSGNFLAINTVPAATMPYAVLTVTFVDPLDSALAGLVAGSGVSVNVYDSEQNVTVNSFDINGVQLESLVLTAADFTGMTASPSFSTGDIHSLQFIDAGGDGFFMDNLTYGEITAIPEPATLGLIGSGLLALGLWRRKRRTN
jgi:hypothetical protein